MSKNLLKLSGNLTKRMVDAMEGTLDAKESGKMKFVNQTRGLLDAIISCVVTQGRRLEKSNERTIAYIKRLRSEADVELTKVIVEENGHLWRNTAKLRAAKFILCHRGMM